MKKTIIMILLATAGLLAQNTATITGTVKDSTGASVPKAQVTATNVGTSLSRTAVSNDEGEYSLEFLPTGEYRVEANVAGFKKFVRIGLVLEINQNARVDVVLQVGAVSEVLTINEAAPLVNTENAQLGRVTSNKEITELPIVDRNVYTLLTLTPGVENSANSFTLGFPEQRTNINGGSDGGAGSVNYYLDGGSNMNGLRNTGAIAPNPDAVQEFKLITNSYSAEYGHFAGGVVTIITKSGTNRLHGSLFEFLRNDKMAAKGWGIAVKAPLHRNQFGATLGGPIKKDKLFFFGSYGGLRQITPQTINGTVPSALERTGDFSQTFNATTGKLVPIIDPLTKIAFTGNIIPAARMDQTSLNVLNYFGKTGLGIAPANLPGNIYQGSVPNPFNSDEFLAKADYLMSARQTISFGYYLTPGNTATQPGAAAPWSIQQFSWRQHNANIGDIFTITPTMINEAHLNFTRSFGGRLNLPGVSLGDLGSKFTVQGTPSLPNITISGYATLSEAIGGPTAGTNFYEARDTLSIVKGRHTIKLGGSVNLQKYVQDTLLNNYGTFNFSGTAVVSANTAVPTVSIGNGFAAFLLGLPATMNQDAPVTAIDDGWYFGLFAQDDWRVTPRLTINAGLRWDLQTPLVDPHDRKLTYQNGAKSTAVPSALPGLLFPGDPGVPRGIVPYDKHQFGPRLGLAWDPFGDGKTSIRAAAGIFYGSISGNEWNTTSNNQPFAIRQQFNTVKSFTDVYGYLAGGDPFPYTYNASAPKFLAPSAPYGVLQDFKWPFTYQLNFSVQRQLTKDLSVTASYVGSLAHRLPFADDLNYPILTATASTSNVNNRRPIGGGTTPVFGQILMITSMEQSSYNALQVTVEKRLSRRFMVKGFYTYSKTLSDVQLDNNTTNGQAMDYSNLALDRGRADFDRRQNMVTSLIFTPNYFTNRGAFLRHTLNAWTVSAIVTLRSGSPLNVTTGSDNNFDGISNDRPLLIGDPTLDPHRSRNDAAAQWFSKAAFDPNLKFVGDGTTPRNFITGPGLHNVDMAIFRDFKIGERMLFQFRGEMTNAFNLVNLGNPTLTASSANFAKITTAGAMRIAQLGARFVF